jgi:hypothetical protein
MVPGIGNARANLAQAIEDLGAMLQDSQALAMKTTEKLLKAGIREAIRDSSVGAQIDTTA